MFKALKQFGLACSLGLALVLASASNSFASSYINIAGIKDLEIPNGYTVVSQTDRGIIFNNTVNKVIVVNSIISKNPDNFKHNITKYKNNLQQLKAVLTQTYTDHYRAPYVITDLQIKTVDNQDMVVFSGFVKAEEIGTIYLKTFIYQNQNHLLTVEASANDEQTPAQTIDFILANTKFN